VAGRLAPNDVDSLIHVLVFQGAARRKGITTQEAENDNIEASTLAPEGSQFCFNHKEFFSINITATEKTRGGSREKQ
jgi:hypothetical protein